MYGLRSTLIVCLLAAAPCAQQGEGQNGEARPDAVLRFEEHFVRARRLAHAGEADRARASAELDAAAELVPDLPDELRGVARLGVEVSRAEALVFERRDAEATVMLVEARRRAVEDGAWRGPYRELADVLLWNVAPSEFDELWSEEREFLRDRESAHEKPDARDALTVVRLSRELDLSPGAGAHRAERELADLAVRMPPGEWRDKACGILAWYFLLQRDLSRANAWADRLPVEVGRHVRAKIALRQGRFDVAARLGRELAETDPSQFQLVGDALEMLGDHDGGRRAYERALASGLTRAERVVVVRGLGDCAFGSWQRTGDAADLETARVHYTAARTELETLPADGHLQLEGAQLDVGLGRVAEAEGDPRRALAAYRRGIAAIGEFRSHLGTDLFGGSVLAVDDLDAIEGVLRVFEAGGEDAFAAMAALESGKARTLLDWIEDPPRDIDADAARALTGAVHELALDSSPEKQREVQRRLRDIEMLSRQAAPLGADALRAHVSRWPDVAFLSYWLGREKCWVAWARGNRAGVIDLGARAVVEPVLRSANASVASVRSDATAALGAASRQFLAHDELRRCLAGASRVVFCPDEELGRLPFEALPLDGTPLGIRFAIERMPSLSIREALAARTARGRGTAVLHSVAGARSIESRFALDPLEQSAAEAALVARAHGDCEVLAGADATVGGFASLLARGPYDYVHVSAHVVTAAVPTQTLLVLADAPASVATLAGMPLDGALVVLSSCRSATGEARAGEGEIGLLGWPLAAGARGAIASVWSVNQQATKDLMGQFHAALADGYDAVEAMRIARSTLAAAPNYAHPHFWAGFGVFAAPSARGPGGSRLAWSGFAVVAALGLGYWLLRRFA